MGVTLEVLRVAAKALFEWFDSDVCGSTSRIRRLEKRASMPLDVVRRSLGGDMGWVHGESQRGRILRVLLDCATGGRPYGFAVRHHMDVERVCQKNTRPRFHAAGKD